MQRVDTAILPMIPEHWPEVARIYKQGIETGIATFETSVPSWEDWNRNHAASCRLVAVVNEGICGWAALSPVSSRCVYGGVGEVSVYVDEDSRSIGVGTSLLQALIRESEKEGYWTLQSGIFPENQVSITMHEKAGFRKVGYREKIGKMDGRWKDNILMERRSHIVGQD
jgi:phosphinothricin acetyltransferase